MKHLPRKKAGRDYQESQSEEDSDEEAKSPTSSRNDSEKLSCNNLKNILDRKDTLPHPSNVKFDIEKWMVYLSGPIELYLKSPLKFPIDENDDYSNITVIKISWGWHHWVILLNNGTVLMGGSNEFGQLNYNPLIKLEIKDELEFHKKINEEYEVLDIGCGTAHTVLLVRDRNKEHSEWKILAWGYHGWLGVDQINEDTYELKHVLIPGLTDFDKIKFLVWKYDSNAVIDSDGNIYYWGDEFDTFRTRLSEKKNWFGQKIVDLSFGFRHSIFLLEDGSIYIIDSKGLK